MFSPSVTLLVSQEKMSSGGFQPSLDGSTLNHNVLQLAGLQWWPVTAHHSPGFQLKSSHLFQSQQKALSAASPNLRAAVFRSLPAIARAVSILHTDCAGKPLQPTSTGNSQVCPPLSLHCWTRSRFLVVFLSEASSHPSSHGTVSSIRMIFFVSSDHRTMSGLRDVWTTWGNK